MDYVELVGTPAADTLTGLDDQKDAIFGREEGDLIQGLSGDDLLDGESGDDKIEGGADNDALRDGLGDDRLFGDDGDDLFVFIGGGLDRAVGGAGMDVFKLTTAMLSDGVKSTVKVIDYMVESDAVDLSGSTIKAYTELANRVLLTVGSDGDVLDLRGVSSMDDITFTSVESPFDSYEECGCDTDSTPPDGEVVTDNPVTDKIFGTEGDDTLRLFGGEKTRATSFAGEDTFLITFGMLTNEQVDEVKIMDYAAGLDVIDLGGAEITGIQELNKRVILTVGPDNDVLDVIGVTEFEDITFADDPLAML